MVAKCTTSFPRFRSPLPISPFWGAYAESFIWMGFTLEFPPGFEAINFDRRVSPFPNDLPIPPETPPDYHPPQQKKLTENKKPLPQDLNVRPNLPQNPSPHLPPPATSPRQPPPFPAPGVGRGRAGGAQPPGRRLLRAAHLRAARGRGLRLWHPAQQPLRRRQARNSGKSGESFMGVGVGMGFGLGVGVGGGGWGLGGGKRGASGEQAGWLGTREMSWPPQKNGGWETCFYIFAYCGLVVETSWGGIDRVWGP